MTNLLWHARDERDSRGRWFCLGWRGCLWLGQRRPVFHGKAKHGWIYPSSALDTPGRLFLNWSCSMCDSISTIALWRREPQTGAICLPEGAITTAEQFPRSTPFATAPRCPVLMGEFLPPRFDWTPELPVHAGWGVLELDGQRALTFRLQAGSTQLYWLANPADPDVWAMQDAWATAGQMALAADFGRGPVFVLSRTFELSPAYKATRLPHSGQSSGPFCAAVARSLMQGELSVFAKSDIPAFPRLTYVQGCLVVTRHTLPVRCQLIDSSAPGFDQSAGGRRQ
jgi:hypothetical protein